MGRALAGNPRERDRGRFEVQLRESRDGPFATSEIEGRQTQRYGNRRLFVDSVAPNDC